MNYDRSLFDKPSVTETYYGWEVWRDGVIVSTGQRRQDHLAARDALDRLRDMQNEKPGDYAAYVMKVTTTTSHGADIQTSRVKK